MPPILFYVTDQPYDFLANVTDIPVKVNINGTNHNAPSSEAIYQACKDIRNPIAQQRIILKSIRTKSYNFL